MDNPATSFLIPEKRVIYTLAEPFERYKKLAVFKTMQIWKGMGLSIQESRNRL